MASPEWTVERHLEALRECGADTTEHLTRIGAQVPSSEKAERSEHVIRRRKRRLVAIRPDCKIVVAFFGPRVWGQRAD